MLQLAFPCFPAATTLLLVFACAADSGPGPSPEALSDPGRHMVHAPGSPYAIGGEPADVAAGDLDGDGDTDLVVVDSQRDRLVVLAGSGTGGFGPARETGLAPGWGPHLVALGDLDGDGSRDAAITSHDSNEVLLLRGRKGGFTPFPTSPVATGSPDPPHNHSLALADLDADGALDLLFGNQGAGSVAVLLGDGHGGFAPAPGSPVAAGRQPYPLAVGDLDGDGALDVAVSDLSGEGVTLLRGDGRGGLAPFPASPVPTPRRPFHVALADLDGDGHLDLVASHDDAPRLSIRLGDGEGGFREAPDADMGIGAWRIAVADFDGDDALDLAGSTRANRVQILHGRGDGTFDRGPSMDTGTGAWNLVTADLDGDGRPDLVALGAEDGTVSAWLQR
jgi:hypothetical protein